MKKHVLAMLFVFGMSANFAGAQNINQGYIVNFPKPVDSKRLIEFGNETEWSTDYRSKNKLELVNGTSFRNKTTAVVEIKNFNIRFSGELVVPTKNDPDNTLKAFSLGLEKDFRKFELIVTNSFNFRHRKRFGVLETEVSKMLRPADEVYIKPFASMSGVYALDGLNNTASNGFFVRTGLEFEGKLGKGHFGFSPQAIFDRSAIQKGNRIAGNVEVYYLVPVGRTFIGPKIEYTNFLFSNRCYLEKRNVFGFGFIFKAKLR